MTVFKNVLKLLKHNIKTIGMYVAIYLVIAMIAIQSAPVSSTQSLDRPMIYLENRDDHPVAQKLVDYLEESNQVIDVDIDMVEDSLFHREIHAIVIIPEGFSEELLAGEQPQMILKTNGDLNGSYVENNVNLFLNTIRAFALAGDVLDDELLSEAVSALDQQVPIEWREVQAQEAGLRTKTAQYFILLNYSIITQIILSVGLILSSYKDRRIEMRQKVSPLPASSVTIQLFLGNLFISVGTWVIYMVVCYLLVPEGMSTYGLPHLLNALVFTFSISAFAGMVATLFYNKDTISMVSTVVGLGASFISGAFVPRELIASSVVNLSKVFPSYWYIDNAIRIGENDFSSYYSHMGVMLLFMLGFIVCAVWVNVRRLKNKEH